MKNLLSLEIIDSKRGYLVKRNIIEYTNVSSWIGNNLRVCRISWNGQIVNKLNMNKSVMEV